ncbi:acyl carrier protein [Paenarthrobacter aromaticivorans]|uniref:Acyl carrier protein n=1 Tax=Paenarthrobacter aromaticivorans TaxID=2849150 RepID=A0ABS6IDF7_9MICC|nr:acyl carrier protein [Paenarthrobacter sp. MMS21-TAE1-1]MBU8868399.1 acyl carrier protein [Paenarthrobacter sp. MMS21-TAE1-1]
MEITAMDVVGAIGSTMDELGHMGPDDSFADLDIDSLSLVEAAVILSNKFGVRVDEFELIEAGSARAAASMVTEKLALQPAI